jgi:molybdopterin-guanine dinucleotide biosynthesis protein A
VNDATAFILAGGQSSRMGSDKAVLVYEGETLLSRMMRTARRVCDRVMICGLRERYGSFGDVVEDIEPGHGPLGGIQAALHATGSDLNLILSVDMPFMHAEFLQWLLEQARSGGRKITAPESVGRLQPLCGVYRRELRGAVDEAMSVGDYRVTALFRRAESRIIGENEIRAAGFDPAIFTNVNTREEYGALTQDKDAARIGAKIANE